MALQRRGRGGGPNLFRDLQEKLQEVGLGPNQVAVQGRGDYRGTLTIGETATGQKLKEPLSYELYFEGNVPIVRGNAFTASKTLQNLSETRTPNQTLASLLQSSFTTAKQEGTNVLEVVANRLLEQGTWHGHWSPLPTQLGVTTKLTSMVTAPVNSLEQLAAVPGPMAGLGPYSGEGNTGRFADVRRMMQETFGVYPTATGYNIGSDPTKFFKHGRLAMNFDALYPLSKAKAMMQQEPGSGMEETMIRAPGATMGAVIGRETRMTALGDSYFINPGTAWVDPQYARKLHSQAFNKTYVLTEPDLQSGALDALALVKATTIRGGRVPPDNPNMTMGNRISLFTGHTGDPVGPGLGSFTRGDITGINVTVPESYSGSDIVRRLRENPLINVVTGERPQVEVRGLRSTPWDMLAVKQPGMKMVGGASPWGGMFDAQSAIVYGVESLKGSGVNPALLAASGMTNLQGWLERKLMATVGRTWNAWEKTAAPGGTAPDELQWFSPEKREAYVQGQVGQQMAGIYKTYGVERDDKGYMVYNEEQAPRIQSLFEGLYGLNQAADRETGNIFGKWREATGFGYVEDMRTTGFVPLGRLSEKGLNAIIPALYLPRTMTSGGDLDVAATTRQLEAIPGVDPNRAKLLLRELQSYLPKAKQYGYPADLSHQVAEMRVNAGGTISAMLQNLSALTAPTIMAPRMLYPISNQGVSPQYIQSLSHSAPEFAKDLWTRALNDPSGTQRSYWEMYYSSRGQRPEGSPAYNLSDLNLKGLNAQAQQLAFTETGDEAFTTGKRQPGLRHQLQALEERVTQGGTRESGMLVTPLGNVLPSPTSILRHYVENDLTGKPVNQLPQAYMSSVMAGETEGSSDVAFREFAKKRDAFLFNKQGNVRPNIFKKMFTTEPGGKAGGPIQESIYLDPGEVELGQGQLNRLFAKGTERNLFGGLDKAGFMNLANEGGIFVSSTHYPFTQAQQVTSQRVVTSAFLASQGRLLEGDTGKRPKGYIGLPPSAFNALGGDTDADLADLIPAGLKKDVATGKWIANPEIAKEWEKSRWETATVIENALGTSPGSTFATGPLQPGLEMHTRLKGMQPLRQAYSREGRRDVSEADIVKGMVDTKQSKSNMGLYYKPFVELPLALVDATGTASRTRLLQRERLQLAAGLGRVAQQTVDLEEPAWSPLLKAISNTFIDAKGTWQVVHQGQGTKLEGGQWVKGEGEFKAEPLATFLPTAIVDSIRNQVKRDAWNPAKTFEKFFRSRGAQGEVDQSLLDLFERVPGMNREEAVKELAGLLPTVSNLMSSSAFGDVFREARTMPQLAKLGARGGVAIPAPLAAMANEPGMSGTFSAIRGAQVSNEGEAINLLPEKYLEGMRKVVGMNPMANALSPASVVTSGLGGPTDLKAIIDARRKVPGSDLINASMLNRPLGDVVLQEMMPWNVRAAMTEENLRKAGVSETDIKRLGDTYTTAIQTKRTAQATMRGQLYSQAIRQVAQETAAKHPDILKVNEDVTVSEFTDVRGGRTVAGVQGTAPMVMDLEALRNVQDPTTLTPFLQSFMGTDVGKGLLADLDMKKVVLGTSTKQVRSPGTTDELDAQYGAYRLALAQKSKLAGGTTTWRQIAAVKGYGSKNALISGVLNRTAGELATKTNVKDVNALVVEGAKGLVSEVGAEALTESFMAGLRPMGSEIGGQIAPEHLFGTQAAPGAIETLGAVRTMAGNIVRGAGVANIPGTLDEWAGLLLTPAVTQAVGRLAPISGATAAAAASSAAPTSPAGVAGRVRVPHMPGIATAAYLGGVQQAATGTPGGAMPPLMGGGGVAGGVQGLDWEAVERMMRLSNRVNVEGRQAWKEQQRLKDAMATSDDYLGTGDIGGGGVSGDAPFQQVSRSFGRLAERATELAVELKNAKENLSPLSPEFDALRKESAAVSKALKREMAPMLRGREALAMKLEEEERVGRGRTDARDIALSQQRQDQLRQALAGSDAYFMPLGGGAAKPSETLQQTMDEMEAAQMVMEERAVTTKQQPQGRLARFAATQRSMGGFFGGGLGAIGFGMFNLNRVWNWTGGAFAKMGEEYAGEQQMLFEAQYQAGGGLAVSPEMSMLRQQVAAPSWVRSQLGESYMRVFGPAKTTAMTALRGMPQWASDTTVGLGVAGGAAMSAQIMATVAQALGLGGAAAYGPISMAGRALIGLGIEEGAAGAGGLFAAAGGGLAGAAAVTGVLAAPVVATGTYYWGKGKAEDVTAGEWTRSWAEGKPKEGPNAPLIRLWNPVESLIGIGVHAFEVAGEKLGGRERVTEKFGEAEATRRYGLKQKPYDPTDMITTIGLDKHSLSKPAATELYTTMSTIYGRTPTEQEYDQWAAIAKTSPEKIGDMINAADDISRYTGAVPGTPDYETILQTSLMTNVNRQQLSQSLGIVSDALLKRGDTPSQIAAVASNIVLPKLKGGTPLGVVAGEVALALGTSPMYGAMGLPEGFTGEGSIWQQRFSDMVGPKPSLLRQEQQATWLGAAGQLGSRMGRRTWDQQKADAVFLKVQRFHGATDQEAQLRLLTERGANQVAVTAGIINLGMAQQIGQRYDQADMWGQMRLESAGALVGAVPGLTQEQRTQWTETLGIQQWFSPQFQQAGQIYNQLGYAAWGSNQRMEGMMDIMGMGITGGQKEMVAAARSGLTQATFSLGLQMKPFLFNKDQRLSTDPRLTTKGMYPLQDMAGNAWFKYNTAPEIGITRPLAEMERAQMVLGQQTDIAQSGYNIFQKQWQIHDIQREYGTVSWAGTQQLYGQRDVLRGQLQASGLSGDALEGALNKQLPLTGVGLAQQQMMVQRGATWQGFGYQQAQLNLQRQFQGLAETQYRYQRQYQLEERDVQRAFGLEQRGWQREDWGIAEGRFETQSGWQLEDIDRATRFATGRQRIDLRRQKDRAIIQQGWQREDFARTETRGERAWQVQDERYEKAIKYEEQINDFTEQRFALQRQGLDLQQDYLNKQMGTAKALQDIEDKRFEDQVKQNQESVGYLEELLGLEVQRRDIMKEWSDELVTIWDETEKTMRAFVTWLKGQIPTGDQIGRTNETIGDTTGPLKEIDTTTTISGNMSVPPPPSTKPTTPPASPPWDSYGHSSAAASSAAGVTLNVVLQVDGQTLSGGTWFQKAVAEQLFLRANL